MELSSCKQTLVSVAVLLCDYCLETSSAEGLITQAHNFFHQRATLLLQTCSNINSLWNEWDALNQSVCRCKEESSNNAIFAAYLLCTALCSQSHCGWNANHSADDICTAAAPLQLHKRTADMLQLDGEFSQNWLSKCFLWVFWKKFFCYCCKTSCLFSCVLKLWNVCSHVRIREKIGLCISVWE